MGASENGLIEAVGGDADLIDLSGITLDLETLSLQVVDVTDGDWQAAGVIVHNVKNRAIAHMLVELPFGPFPMALGVLYDDPRPTFESAVVEQNARASEGREPSLTTGAFLLQQQVPIVSLRDLIENRVPLDLTDKLVVLSHGNRAAILLFHHPRYFSQWRIGVRNNDIL